ncbi:N-methyl-L-tryptophan oxidase [Rhizomonospora bruguierae]|uniref:N-methyl-L-tryptophan oxidase n=1 Tax=Rhizomonospora bruguierae TaxID=1581705 RepID=UPI0020BD4AAE|nr:N-methyl-L-tryptophan oxidase [Micromonospora sp. NBRC 107566]
MAPDVIVVGLGSMGAAAAYQLAKRGARVVGLDRYRPPHRYGSHGGGSRIIRMAYAEGAGYVPLLHRAHKLWREAERAAGAKVLTRTGGLILGRPESPTVAGAIESAARHGLAHEVLDADEVRRRFPMFTPGDGDVALYEEAAGAIRPEVAIGMFLDLAAGAGADLRYDAPITGWRAGNDGVAVTTTDGEITAERLVLCPGAWAGDMLADLGVPLKVQRRIQHYWESGADEMRVGRFPVWIWESARGVVAYGMPRLSSPPGWEDLAPELVKVAFHTGDEPDEPGEILMPTLPEEVRAIQEWLEPRLPRLLHATWMFGQPCRYTTTPDGHFVLGRHPDHERVAVAAGFSGHGFKFVPVVGEILADLTLAGGTANDIRLFRPDRFRTVA